MLRVAHTSADSSMAAICRGVACSVAPSMKISLTRMHNGNTKIATNKKFALNKNIALGLKYSNHYKLILICYSLGYSVALSCTCHDFYFIDLKSCPST